MREIFATAFSSQRVQNRKNVLHKRPVIFLENARMVLWEVRHRIFMTCYDKN